MQRTAWMMLVLVSLAWGVGMPIWQVSARLLTPTTAMCLRFGLSAAVVYLLMRGRVAQPKAMAWGVPIGILNHGTNFAMAHALTHIRSSRCAFLLGTSVAIIPALAFCTGQGRARRSEWGAALMSLLGLMIITQFRPQALAVGDLWALGAAMMSSSGILLLGRLGQNPGLAPGSVLFWEYVVTAILSLPFMLRQAAPTWPVLHAALPTLVYSAVIGSVFTQWLQMRYQARAGPATAALIYSLRPLFTCTTAVLFMGEHLDSATAAGGALMFWASILPHLLHSLGWPRRRLVRSASAASR